MKTLLSILCFFSIQFSFSQNRFDFQVKEVTDAPQCKMVSAENYCRAFQWSDSAGNNFLVLKTIMEQGSDPNEGDFTEITLTALHYINDEAHIVWKTNDFIKHCMFDATLEVIDSSICITDLNKDGKAEISFVY